MFADGLIDAFAARALPEVYEMHDMDFKAGCETDRKILIEERMQYETQLQTYVYRRTGIPIHLRLLADV